MTKRNPMTYERGECPLNDRDLSCSAQATGSVSDSDRLDWLEANASAFGIEPDWVATKCDSMYSGTKLFEYTDMRKKIDALMEKQNRVICGKFSTYDRIKGVNMENEGG